MTIEEAIKILEYPVKKWSMEWDEREDGLSYYEALDLAISALRQEDHFLEVTKKVEPLTLDELRQMPIRDWVWIDVIHSKEAVSSYYRKYDGYKTDEIFWCGYPGLGFRFFYEDYGKTWLAYRKKPEEDDRGERKENENVRR